MKNLVIALGLTLAASTAAYAESGALDVVGAPSNLDTAASVGIDYTPTASIGSAYQNPSELPRLGDGSPVYQPSAGSANVAAFTPAYADPSAQPKLGDGSPATF